MESQPSQLNSFEQSANSEHEKMTHDDEVVWHQFKNGSQSSLTFIYRNNVHSLFNYGRQFTSNRELVKDAIHDVFIDIIHSRERLSSTDSIRFYLLKSLRNKIVKLLSKRSREIQAEHDMSYGIFQVAVSHEITLIHKQLDIEKQQIIQEKLNELPVLQREAILLYFYEGMKYAQIAEILGVKVKSARALLYRAIDSMGHLLRPQMKG